jgi:hypothetical protein
VKKLFVALPSHDSKVNVPTLLSLLTSQAEIIELGWTMHVECIGGDSDIARARNALVGKFLASDCTDLVFVDADISWGPGALVRLVSPVVDFVAGVYRLRTDDLLHYPVQWTDPKCIIVDEVTSHPLLRAHFVPGGFWRLSRHMLEVMAKTVGQSTDLSQPDVSYPFLFDWTWEDGKRRSEDYTFCARWRELGGGIWVDPAICLDHTGMKLFQGNLLAHLAKETADAQAAQDTGGLTDRVKRALAA